MDLGMLGENEDRGKVLIKHILTISLEADGTVLVIADFLFFGPNKDTSLNSDNAAFLISLPAYHFT